MNSSRNGSSTNSHFSKDQLIDLFKNQKDSGDLSDGVSNLYVNNWAPNISNGTSSATWGRRDEHNKDGQVGVDICWDRDGSVVPLNLRDLTEDEKELFLGSVNSPLKPPIPATNKDGTPKEALSLRKPSISQSQNTSGPYGLASPTNSRPTGRRRDTGDAYPFPSNATASPAGNSRYSREESNTVTPPPALVRRRTDFKESNVGSGTDERDKDRTREAGADNPNPFGSLRRTTTAPFSAGITGPSSPWSATPQSAGFSPMGAFGSFAIGTNSTQPATTEKKPGYGSMRGESRFKGLMAKDSSEDIGKSAREKPSLGNLGKLSEADPTRPPPSWMEARSNRPTSNDTDPFPDDDLRSGSAALGGGQDLSPPRQSGIPTYGTPNRRDPRDDPGFSAFGMTSDTTGIRDIFHGRDNYSHHTPQHRAGDSSHEPMSPTNTNPYQSPEHERTDTEDDTDESDIQNPQFPGLGSFQVDQSVGPGMAPFGGLGNLGRVPGAFEAAASDRSQTSSTGPTRGFPSLSGLGGLPGLGGAAAWPTGQQSIGTPIRERGGFGAGFDSMFGSVGELQSPSLAGLGSSSFFGQGPVSGLGGSATMGRGSKLGALFPPAAMQDQIRSSEQNRSSNDDGSSEGRSLNQPSAYGRNAFGTQAPGSGIPTRDSESPFRANRMFDDYPGARNPSIGFSEPVGTPFGQMQSSGSAQPSILSTIGGRSQPSTTSTQSQGVTSPASNQPPAAQQRTMVMPDRMRWIYQDPQGNTQGPWSGLEMHDWYKAGFFSPELLVKKREDPEYEPLAQLIRRIGNSREPFLVPQIGIPHGPPSTQAGNAWAGQGISATPTVGPGAQPPFASSFPSFGTTLTAEQQNALERRKQEEQYLMARQKEHLAVQQQALAKQAQMGIGAHGILPQQLHHHSSAHSLHSQPSFGSITSPGVYQPSPTQGPIPGPTVSGLFDNSFRPAPSGLGPIGMDVLGNIREEDIPGMMERLNIGRSGQLPYGGAPVPFGQQQPDSNANAQVAAMLNDRARLQREQAEHDALQRISQSEQQAAQNSADRLQQFHDLRLQTDVDHPSTKAPTEGIIGKPSSSFAEQVQHQQRTEALRSEAVNAQMSSPTAETAPLAKSTEALSLTEQVQKAASSKQSPAPPQSPWAKVETSGLPQPFPPPQSGSPLPAPAAQRKHNVADTLHAESRSRSETPSADTPSASIAPWAKEPAEAPRGPSLKEIQEAEARKAAQQEEVAAAARRAALERELLAQAQAPPPAPGLPSSSTWASSASPITPNASTPSAWVKPLAGKAPGQPSTGKKTLQQIQKEEEARKHRAAAAAAAANATISLGASVPTLSSGKRYADLASKQTATPPPGNGAWTTVGASGKAKAPMVAIPTGPAAVRSTSSGVVSSPVIKPKLPGTRNATLGGQLAGQVNAQEEFRKWAVGELKGDLEKGINPDDFVAQLVSFPLELEILTEAVHSASNTIDSRHFAEEFLRRRKLADKGIVDASAQSAAAEAKSAAGGWSEVAKKGGQAQQVQQGVDTSPFKVVAAKKKGGKR
ncbi:hypothetical protein BU16DRAFT_6463 [Lophium mytilinum]|uniref:GYF domain-containing protein n=1 Tax=Lophium mytilinum TaxID=390894 RepID=A0A6A6RCU2_9PEZI|nr:hypothetical protein BU16DRAFT_6463 [Lophium mytilinum]